MAVTEENTNTVIKDILKWDFNRKNCNGARLTLYNQWRQELSFQSQYVTEALITTYDIDFSLFNNGRGGKY